MKSFAVVALLGCFLGALMTTVASKELFETAENQEDESKLHVPNEDDENDGVDRDEEQDEEQDGDDEVDDPER